MNTNYEVIFEDKNLLIVNKKSGIIVHKTKYEITNNTLIDLIRQEYKSDELNLINRIDKDTSGLLMIGKNRNTINIFQQMLQSQKINKFYLAITEKILPAKIIKINLSLGRARTKINKFSHNNSKKYKPAVTIIEKLDNSFIKIQLLTGRTHQIRAHLKSIKYPILNDHLYGKKIEGDDFGQYLHSYKLSFHHPLNENKEISVKVDPPKEFLDQLNKLGITYNSNY